MPRAIVDVTFLAELGARAELAARMGEPTFSLPELAPIARLVRGDARVPELHARAQRWSATNGGYHELVRLAASYVEALDRALPPAAAVYVPKAAGELEPMLALWPHVLVIPLALALSARDLIRLRAHPVHVLGVVTCPPGAMVVLARRPSSSTTISIMPASSCARISRCRASTCRTPISTAPRSTHRPAAIA
ncbi:MAG: hypothetical protein U1E76_04060 [Planctomycetota bacterium]